MDKLPEKIAMSKRSWTDWQRFSQKLDIYLRATRRDKEEDAVKIAILLAAGGDVILDEYNTLYKTTDEPGYDEVRAKLEENFKDGESEHYSSHIFRERKQQKGETFAKWLTYLKLLVKPCNYGGENRMIRDQIHYGSGLSGNAPRATEGGETNSETNDRNMCGNGGIRKTASSFQKGSGNWRRASLVFALFFYETEARKEKKFR